MNKRQALLVLLLIVAVLISGCLAEKYETMCKQGCKILGYEHHELIDLTEWYTCQCWNKGMVTRHNPWAGVKP